MDGYYMLMNEIVVASEFVDNVAMRVLSAYPTPPKLESDKLLRRTYDEVMDARDMLTRAKELLERAKTVRADEERKGLR